MIGTSALMSLGYHSDSPQTLLHAHARRHACAVWWSSPWHLGGLRVIWETLQ
jgi:hypothetical protein